MLQYYTLLYNITVLQYRTELSSGDASLPIAGIAHYELQSMTSCQALPTDDGAGVAGQVG